ncbi:helix-turn-helix domain-containing protein [Streptomyces sp. NBS 14/10]|uniref:GlxA family transcriptional regulator n=1 Tax=Streptomyces sp. NBS 14/10 TaxID=1945643 RepID=UPI000B7E1AAE|nr:helix-turn-helix domain-containing protein [Streptomyces sp. NBS 14/10]KAK1180675.1 helix-turn-helix domain-containing protein [Streptomyces sp. NBS 14/10]
MARPADTPRSADTPHPADTPRHIVAVAVADGAPIFELAVPCEVFGIDRSDIVDPWYELRLCAAEPGPLRTSAGLGIPTPYGLDDLVEADTVVVAACPRAVQLAPPPELVTAVRKAHELGRRIVSICSGAYVLAAAGLLADRRATTHWMNAADFAFRFPEVDLDPTALYVEDGSILTSAGTGAAIDLCLHLVRQDHGAAVANEVARRMVVPPHREGGQTQYAKLPVRPRAGGGEGLAPVLQWARERLHEPLTVAGLAAVAHMSERTFARRFRDALGTTPLQWILQERVRLAQELLETTDEPVESVARRTGFGTAPNLRHHFRRLTSVSPQTYRQVFRSRSIPPGAPRSAPHQAPRSAPWE